MMKQQNKLVTGVMVALLLTVMIVSNLNFASAKLTFFGNQDSTTQFNAWSGGVAYGSRYYLNQSCTTLNIYAQVCYATGNTHWILSIYNDSSGVIGSLVASTGTIYNDVDQSVVWVGGSVSTNLAVGYYWLMCDPQENNNWNLRYKAGETGQSLAGSTYGDMAFAIYCTFNDGEPEPTPTPHPTPIFGDPLYKWYNNSFEGGQHDGLTSSGGHPELVNSTNAYNGTWYYKVVNSTTSPWGWAKFYYYGGTPITDGVSELYYSSCVNVTIPTLGHGFMAVYTVPNYLDAPEVFVGVINYGAGLKWYVGTVEPNGYNYTYLSEFNDYFFIVNNVTAYNSCWAKITACVINYPDDGYDNVTVWINGTQVFTSEHQTVLNGCYCETGDVQSNITSWGFDWEVDADAWAVQPTFELADNFWKANGEQQAPTPTPTPTLTPTITPTGSPPPSVSPVIIVPIIAVGGAIAGFAVIRGRKRA